MSKFFVMLSDGTQRPGLSDEGPLPKFYDTRGEAAAFAACARKDLEAHGTLWRGVHVLLCEVIEDFGEV